MKKKKRSGTKKSPRKKIKKFTVGTLIALIAAALIWTQNNFKESPPPQPGEPASLYANQTKDNLVNTFCSAIDSAKESVSLVVYALTDPHVIAALKKKSQEGVNVRVVCDAQASPYITRKLGPAISTIRRFGPGLMHQKMLVIDNKQTWIGSANMTTDSLTSHGNLVLAFDNSHLASLVTKKAHSLQTEGKAPAFPHEELNIGNQNVELWFLPDNKDASLRLKQLIRTAQKTIRVAMFTWTRLDLANTIADAARRGVDCEIVIDHYSGKGASAPVVDFFKTKGMKVGLSRGGPLLHHKFLYIDGKTLVNGSANWTKAAFSKNDDCFMILHDLNEQQRSQMDTLWQVIYTEAERL